MVINVGPGKRIRAHPTKGVDPFCGRFLHPWKIQSPSFLRRTIFVLLASLDRIRVVRNTRVRAKSTVENGSTFVRLRGFRKLRGVWHTSGHRPPPFRLFSPFSPFPPFPPFPRRPVGVFELPSNHWQELERKWVVPVFKLVIDRLLCKVIPRHLRTIFHGKRHKNWPSQSINYYHVPARATSPVTNHLYPFYVNDVTRVRDIFHRIT